MTTLPDTARRCSLPGCHTWYDTATVSAGYESAAGWMRWNSLGLRLCPNHSWLWVPDTTGHAPHSPVWSRDRTGAVWLHCDCSWRLNVTGRATRESADQYTSHLAEAALSRTTPQASGHDGSTCA